LSLDCFFDLSNKRVFHLFALDQFPGLPELSRPFTALHGWDKQSLLTEAHVPSWWRAYTAIKHDSEGLRSAATLANATAAVAALFQLIQSSFGFRILTGGVYDVPRDTKMRSMSIRSAPRWARLFHESDFRSEVMTMHFGP
jgi:hypothetical protein